MCAVGSEQYCCLCCEHVDKADVILNLGQHQLVMQHVLQALQVQSV